MRQSKNSTMEMRDMTIPKATYLKEEDHIRIQLGKRALLLMISNPISLTLGKMKREDRS